MTTLLYLDTETWSECDLIAHGTHRYAEHASTRIMVAQYAWDDGDPVVIDCTHDDIDEWVALEALKATLADIAAGLRPDVRVVIHNSAFDRALIRHAWGIALPASCIDDTMVRAMAHGLPGSLDKIGRILRVDADEHKDKRGRELIKLFCKPRPKTVKLRRATRETHPVEWAEFLEYSRQDVPAMRAIHRKLPSWNYRPDGAPGSPGLREYELWVLDQQINDRGFAVDLQFAQAALDTSLRVKHDLREQISEATDGEVSSATKRDALLKYLLEEHGVTLPDLTADTLKRRLDDPELPDHVKLLIGIRLEAGMASSSKYAAALKVTSTDGRLRNGLQFAGALRTQRWAGRMFQPHNMKRPDKDMKKRLAAIVEATKLHVLDLVEAEPMRALANAVRGCIVAPAGRKLCIADLSNIEGRKLAWLAGEQWKLDAFAAYDNGVGEDMYKAAYGKAFNIHADDVDDYQRQIGKVMELGCLAGDTPVVTERGIKRLDSVTKEDRLWDGNQWVTHDGLIFKGVKQTLQLGGISLTPDHKVLCGEEWLEAKELSSNKNTHTLALGTASANLPSWASSASDSGCVTATSPERNAHAVHRHTLCTSTTCETGAARGATPAPKKQQVTGEKSSMATPTCALTKATGCVCSTEYLQQLAAATPRRQSSTTPTAGEEFLLPTSGEKAERNFCAICSRCLGGTTHQTTLTDETLTKATSQATCASSQPVKTEAQINARCENCSSECSTLKPVYDILNAGPLSRFTVITTDGPLIVHNCGYQGGVGAFITFAAVYNLDLDALAAVVWEITDQARLDDANGRYDWTVRKRRTTFGLPERTWIACQVLVTAWRDAHPATVQLWADAEDAMRDAIRNPGTAFAVGEHIKVQRDGSWTRVRLPSGRVLCYLHCDISESGQITYAGVNQYTRQWGRIKTYGGKLVENWTQASARDVLAWNMPEAQARGYDLVLTVHDENIAETPDTEEYTWQELAEIMATVPPWAQGLPLSAAGFEIDRYKKE